MFKINRNVQGAVSPAPWSVTIGIFSYSAAGINSCGKRIIYHLKGLLTPVIKSSEESHIGNFKIYWQAKQGFNNFGSGLTTAKSYNSQVERSTCSRIVVSRQLFTHGKGSSCFIFYITIIYKERICIIGSS